MTNVLQVYEANPASNMQSADLLLLGRSPYASGNDMAITWANILATFLPLVYSNIQNESATTLLGNPTGSLTHPSEITLGLSLAFVGTVLQTVAMTGDVTTSANSFSTTIGPNKVSYPKMQQASASTLIGNPTGSLANIEEVTLGATLAFSGAALQTTAHTGDATSAANSNALTLATVNANVGTFGDASHVPQVTLTGKGLVTGCTSVPVTPTAIGAPSGSGTSTGTNTGDQTITLTGPVTGTGTGSFATTITNGAVTYAKIQNESATTLLGNPTGSPISPEEITLGASFAFSGTALQTVAHTGDVTSAANSLAMTIAPNAVTYAKMQSETKQTILGNPTGNNGAVSEITLGTNLSFAGSVLNATGFASPLTTVGDILGYSSTNARVPVGSDNQILVADSTQTLGVKYQYPTIPGTNETEPYFWDFLSNGGNTNDRSWGQTTSGTGASVTSPTSVSTNGSVDGQVALLCANLNSYAYISPGQSSGVAYCRYLNGGQMTLECRVSLVTASTSAERYQFQFGFVSAGGSTAPFGVYFTYSDNVNSGQWTGTCKNGSGSVTATGGSVVAIATQYRLTIVVNSAATSVSFYVNGILLGSAITSDISTTTALAPVIQLTKTATSSNTSEEADIDYIFYQKQFSTPR